MAVNKSAYVVRLTAEPLHNSQPVGAVLAAVIVNIPEGSAAGGPVNGM
jgi:hypothetical protein